MMEQQSLHSGPRGLEAREISKRFSNVSALYRVSITIPPGHIVGLAGHNGAGKSTLLRSLSGAIQPDEGQIFLDGVPIELKSPAAALAQGIVTVHQELSLLPNLTITQNAFLARERTRMGMLQLGSMRAEAQAIVTEFGLDIDVERPVDRYPVATRQLLELAIATHRNVRFLLLDEPTTSLEGDQIDRLLAVIRNLARERGVGVLFINHKLDELYSVADHIVALVDGQVRINRPVSSVPREEVVRVIAGDDVAAQIQTHSAAPSPASLRRSSRDAAVAQGVANAPALQVVHLKTPKLRDVNLVARQGRVLGIYGLVGSGRSEFLRSLIGVEQIVAGNILLFGKPYIPRSPVHARRNGIVYLTEDRKRDGMIATLDAIVNVALPVLNRFSRTGFLNRAEMSRCANEHLDILKVRGDRSQPVRQLSGGNQQKVLLARALAQDPMVLLLDEPTKGVDIGVKVDIHHMIRSLAHDTGLTILMVSSEEEEILEVADDVAVFVSGSCDGSVEPAESLTVNQLRRIAWPQAS